MKITLTVAATVTVALLGLLAIPILVSEENTILLFFGRFHPLILHVPIGALIGLFFLEILNIFIPKLKLDSACQALLWFSSISAIPAVTAGFLLASSGGYNETTLGLHQWLGWGTAFLSIWLLVLRERMPVYPKNGVLLYRTFLTINVLLLSLAGHFGGSLTHGSNYLTQNMPAELKMMLGVEMSQSELLVMAIRAEGPDAASKEALLFADHIQPIMTKYCFKCHGEDKQKGDIRLDVLDWDMVNGSDAESWHRALDMINSGEMPPEDKEQLSDNERRAIVDWVTHSLGKATVARKKQHKGSMKRLTKAQYTHTLNELLGVPVNFGDVLPEDGKSEMGFSNNANVLQTSALHIDYYQKIAREALDKAIVFGEKPKAMRYKVSFGENIGVGQPSAEYGGYQTSPIKSDDLVVDILDENSNPLKDANAAEDSSITMLKKKIGIGMRGSGSDRYQIVKNGLLLKSALPAKERTPKSWQGPSPNLKLLIREEFPRVGDFVLRVEASRGYLSETNERLISLREQQPALKTGEAIYIAAKDCADPKNLKLVDNRWLLPTDVAAFTSAEFKYHIPKAGFYQVDLIHPYVADDAMPSYRLTIIGDQNRISERLYLEDDQKNLESITRPVMLVYLNEGEHTAIIGGKFFVGFSHIVFTPLSENDPLPKELKDEARKNFLKYDSINPSIRVFAGARTDDGMDYRNFDLPREVSTPFGGSKLFEFEGRLENLPIPNPQAETSGDLASILTLGLWNNHLVKDPKIDGPPLLIKSVEFEAPYFPDWPPPSHTRIFFDAPRMNDKEVYTKEVLERFMIKAFRRPLGPGELERYMGFWENVKEDYERYEDGVKEVLIAVLCSPNFLYVFEPEQIAENEDKDEFFLASQLSYFLWNSAPDEELMNLAAAGKLERKMSDQIERMVKNPKIERMIRSFTYEWLRIDRQNSMNTDVDEYPDYTRFVKEDMKEETYHFIRHVLKENRSILNFIDSDFAMLNQNLAEFYGIEGVLGSEFRPVKLEAYMNRGGLLSQGAFLNGHSDGVQAHPIKRAVWLKEKILGDPPPPPPPNVPELDTDTPGFEELTLKDQLFLHRNKASCMDCHKKIDPFGVVFENYDAVGRYQTKAKDKPIDSKSVLPDGTEVEGIQGIKDYILKLKKDDFTTALVEHLYAYALGRDISFADEKEIDTIVEEVIDDDYRFQTVIEQIVLSPSFYENKNKSWLAKLGL